MNEIKEYIIKECIIEHFTAIEAGERGEQAKNKDLKLHCEIEEAKYTYAWWRLKEIIHNMHWDDDYEIALKEMYKWRNDENRSTR